MEPNARAVIAAIARQSGRSGPINTIYDYSQGRHITVSGNINGDSISAYDHHRGCHISGSGGSLFDYGRGSYINLTVENGSISGYDYGSGYHFSGSVSGNSVSLYDHEDGQYHNFG